MNSQSIRSTVVLILLFGTFALAVPYVSTAVDGWLFSKDDIAKEKWKANRPATQPTPALQPASPTLVPAATTAPTMQPTAFSHDEPIGSEPLAFEYQQPAAPPARPAPEFRPIAYEQPIARDPATIQADLEYLGASYVVVEQVENGNRFECRALMPLAPESSYLKAFSGTGTSPQAAMEQVLAEARAWKRASSQLR